MNISRFLKSGLQGSRILPGLYSNNLFLYLENYRMLHYRITSWSENKRDICQMFLCFPIIWLSSCFRIQERIDIGYLSRSKQELTEIFSYYIISHHYCVMYGLE